MNAPNARTWTVLSSDAITVTPGRVLNSLLDTGSGKSI